MLVGLTYMITGTRELDGDQLVLVVFLESRLELCGQGWVVIRGEDLDVFNHILQLAWRSALYEGGGDVDRGPHVWEID